MPPGEKHARVIARGKSLKTSHLFNLTIAFDGNGNGQAVVDSSFHHFADYNFDPRMGSPSLVSEAPRVRAQGKCNRSRRCKNVHPSTSLVGWRKNESSVVRDSGALPKATGSWRSTKCGFSKLLFIAAQNFIGQ